MVGERRANHALYFEKAYPAVEKRLHRRVVRAAQRGGPGAAALGEADSHVEAWIALAFPVRERQRPRPRRVEAADGRILHAVGVTERVLNRQAHVRRAELRLHRAVHELHHRMDNALGVDHDFYVVPFHPEQPARLDDFERLVHHRRRVDGYLAPHLPSGMFEGVVRRGVFQAVDGRVSERAAGRGDDELGHRRRAFAADALPDGVRLAVEGQDFDPVGAGALHDGFAREDDGFLVGERDALARVDGGERGRDGDVARGGGDDGVDVGMRGDFGQPAGFSRAGRGGDGGFVGARPVAVEESRTKLARLLAKQPRVAVAGEADHVEALRKRSNHVERLRPDRPGRTQNRKTILGVSHNA